MQLYLISTRFRRQIGYVAALCHCTGDCTNDPTLELPRNAAEAVIVEYLPFDSLRKLGDGPELLSLVYAECTRAHSHVQAFLYAMLRSLSAPYLRMLSRWCFAGQLQDEHGEFLVVYHPSRATRSMKFLERKASSFTTVGLGQDNAEFLDQMLTSESSNKNVESSAKSFYFSLW